jgi:4-diphosphocytidyl-2-C-methyl-D-erythritol kinase
MPPILEPAPAKVNLFLHVGERRGDGYHELTSLVVFPQIGDHVSAALLDVIPAKARQRREPGPIHPPAQSETIMQADRWIPDRRSRGVRDDGVGELSLEIDGPFAVGLPNDGSNLVLRAAQALRHQALGMGRPVPGARIALTKNLPVASGIGGGSADAAATLRALNKVWGLHLPQETLRAVALTLGSDVPVCLEAGPQWMEGRGERLAAGPVLPALYMVLVNPGVPVATAPVFQALRVKSGAGRPEPPPASKTARDWAGWLAATTHNDLQDPAIGIAPQIAEVLAALRGRPGCLLARMSGSGATCFGLFETQDLADAAAAAMPQEWWARASFC